MIAELDVIGASTELLGGCVLALARHNELWWRRERADGRVVSPNWVERLRYRAPAPSRRLRLRDVGTLLANGATGGCGELAAAYVSWLWSLNLPADLETLRTSELVWHSRVLRQSNGRRVIWDPERVVLHVAA